MLILHLVLYSPEPPHYASMMQATQRWYAKFQKEVTTLYYYRDSEIDAPECEGNMLKLPGTENYRPGILQKTIQALEVFFTTTHKVKYDFVVRSNVSTVINFAVLLPLLKRHANHFDYGGPHIMASNEVHATGQVPDKLLPLDFVKGTCIIMRHDMVEMLLQSKHELNLELDDDPSIGMFFKTYDIMPKVIGIQYAFFDKSYNISEISAFRNHHFHSDRKEDVTNTQRASEALCQWLDIVCTKPLVQSVHYHTKDITGDILLLCKVNGHWTTNQDNASLDFLFGDPAPGVPKTLQITFCDNRCTFDQKATLTFFWTTAHADFLQVR